MIQWMKKRWKENKGFTLVELIIVIAILAILVGLLAPQYVKYVEKSRKSTDVSNLESLVEGVKIAAADTDYNIAVGTYKITMTSNETTIADETTPATGSLTTIQTALKEYTGKDFSNGTCSTLKLKSNRWGDSGISATIEIKSTGSVTVTYSPSDIETTIDKNS